MTRHRLSIVAAAVVAGATILLGARPAFAGPPLICFPFNINGARSLPMGPMDHEGWRAIDPTYDVSHLVGDTIALLSANTPIIVRMETLRRATVYVGVNPRLGDALLNAVEARAKAATPDAALSMFDLGYLVETYRQAAPAFRGVGFPSVGGIDGYALVQKAAAFRQDAQIEFAAAVITAWPRRPEYATHLRNAEAASKADALLASNLTTRFQ